MRNFFLALFLFGGVTLTGCHDKDEHTDDTAVACPQDTVDTVTDSGGTDTSTSDTSDTSATDTGTDTGGTDTGADTSVPVDTGADTGTSDTSTGDTSGTTDTSATGR